ncbi:MAG: alpha/beta fold hydrolase [Deltaproteobacteria bacterium]|nr:alpha/beta fold hydrolase [Deltaproteobacteria bacterium]
MAGCQGSDALAPEPGEEPGTEVPGGDDPEPASFCEGKVDQPADSVWTITSGDLTREFRVHVPEGYDPSMRYPVVLNFHGFTSNSWQQVALSGMNDKADEAGFIAVHPDGVGLSQSWNAGVCCGTAASQEVDDVQFVRDMLDDLSTRLCVDDSRIYATGMSNGGFLSHRLACELPDRIAAIAPVAGVMGIPFETCDPGKPVPVMHFHGTWDTLVPYDGNLTQGMPSVEETVAAWAERNGCSTATSETFRSGDSVCQSFEGCPSSGAVSYCTVDGGGHTWPGGLPVPAMGKTTNELSATDAMWDFFSRFSTQ